MLQIRKSGARGLGDHGWLKSRHTFSFADYFDPGQMGFRTLRVINEDRIEGGTGFGAHPHRDMEIISYVVSGALEHEDSMGNKTVIRPCEVQRMTAGTGVVHAEYNHFKDKETHFFQIWIMPKSRGGAPGYGQRSFEKELAERKLVLTVSGDGRDGSIPIQQDAELYISRLKPDDTLNYELRKGRGAWLQLVRGSVSVNGEKLEAGDGLAATDVDLLTMKAHDAAEILLFDLA